MLPKNQRTSHRPSTRENASHGKLYGGSLIQKARNLAAKYKADAQKAMTSSEAKEVKSLLGDIGGVYTGEAATALKGRLTEGDDKAFTGEFHAMLNPATNPTSLRLANYAGPGTKTLERLARGDVPVSAVDQAAQAHDIRYMLAQTKADFRMADERLVKRIKDLKKAQIDTQFNRSAIAIPIEAKMAAEDIGLRDPMQDQKIEVGLSQADKDILTNKLNELAQKGEGLVPGMSLRNSILNKRKLDCADMVQSSHPVKKSRHGGKVTVTMPGRGLRLAGGSVKTLKNKIAKQALKTELVALRGDTQAIRQENSKERRKALLQTAQDAKVIANEAMDMVREGADLYEDITGTGLRLAGGKKKATSKKTTTKPKVKAVRKKN